MSRKTLNRLLAPLHIDWREVSVVSVVVVLLSLVAFCSPPSDRGDLEARVQHLEAAVDALTCQCPEAEPGDVF